VWLHVGAEPPEQPVEVLLEKIVDSREAKFLHVPIVFEDLQRIFAKQS
jgi:hypothetical protein